MFSFKNGPPYFDINDLCRCGYVGGFGWFDSFRFGVGFTFLILPQRAVTEAPGFVAGFHDMAVMREPVQQGGRRLGVDKHAAPLAEGQVGIVIITLVRS